MGFGAEMKDFVAGFKAGYSMLKSPTAAEKERKDFEDETGAAQDDAEKNAAEMPPVSAASGETPDVAVDDPTLAGVLKLARKDSGNDYNALTYKRDKTPGGKADLQNMTIADVYALQDKMPAMGHASTAVGGYQTVKPTLQRAVQGLGLDPTSTKFDAKTQDKIAAWIATNDGGYGQYQKDGNADAFAHRLSRVWAILPTDKSGKGFYDGFNGNKAGVGWADLQGVLQPRPAAQVAYANTAIPDDDGDPASEPDDDQDDRPAVMGHYASGGVVDRYLPEEDEDVPDPRVGALPDDELDPALPSPDLPEERGIPTTSQMQAERHPAIDARLRAGAAQRASVDAQPAMGAVPDPEGDVATAKIDAAAGAQDDVTQWLDPQYDIQADAAKAAQEWEQAALAHPDPKDYGAEADRSQARREADTAEERVIDHGPLGAEGNAQGVPYQKTRRPEVHSGGDPEDKPVPPRFHDNDPEDARRVAATGVVPNNYNPDEGQPRGREAIPSDEPAPAPAKVAAAQPKVTPKGKPQERPASLPGGKPQRQDGIRRVAVPGEEPAQAQAAPSPLGENAQDSVYAATRNYEQSHPAQTAAAIKGGMRFIQGAFGMTRQAGLPGQDPTRQKGVEAYARNIGATSPEEVKAGYDVIDPRRVMPQDARMMALMNKGYEFYMKRGQPDKAMKYAAGLLMHTKAVVAKMGALGIVAAQHGDWEGVGNAVTAGYSQIPDGQSIKVERIGPQGAEFALFDQNGNLTRRGKATADQVMQVLGGMQNGSAWLEQIQAFVSKSGKNNAMTPYQQKSLELQDRRLKLDEQRLKDREAGVGGKTGTAGPKLTAAERKAQAEQAQTQAQDQAIDQSFDGKRQAIDAANPEDARARGFGQSAVNEKADTAVGTARADRAFQSQTDKKEIPQSSDMTDETDAALKAALPAVDKAANPDAFYALRNAATDIAAGNRIGLDEAAGIVKAAALGQVKVDRSGLVLVNGRSVKLSGRAITAIAQLRAQTSKGGFTQVSPGAGNIQAVGGTATQNPGKAGGAGAAQAATQNPGPATAPRERLNEAKAADQTERTKAIVERAKAKDAKEFESLKQQLGADFDPATMRGPQDLPLMRKVLKDKGAESTYKSYREFEERSRKQVEAERRMLRR